MQNVFTASLRQTRPVNHLQTPSFHSCLVSFFFYTVFPINFFSCSHFSPLEINTSHCQTNCSAPNTNTLQLFLEACPLRATNNRLVCRISDELLTHVCGLQPHSKGPWPRVASKNRGILTPSCYLAFSMGRHIFAPCGDTMGGSLQNCPGPTLTTDYY